MRLSRTWPTQFFCLALFLCLKTFAHAESVVSEAYPVDRYESIWKHSPFTLSSAGDDMSSQELALTGILEVNNETYASVVDKQSKQRFLVSKEPNSQGLSVVRIQNPNDPATLVVTLRQGSENFTLRYDLNYLKDKDASSASATPSTATAPSAPPAVTPTSNSPAPPPVTRPPIQRALIVPGRPPTINHP